MEWGVRSNFQWVSKNFSIENEQFLYKRQLVAIEAKQQQLEIKTFMKVLVKACVPELWLLIKTEIQLIQKFASASFCTHFIKMLNLTLSLETR